MLAMHGGVRRFSRGSDNKYNKIAKNMIQTPEAR